MSEIDLENSDSEKAVLLLLAAAAAAQVAETPETPAVAAPEPADLQKLFDRQKELGNQAVVIERKLQELRSQEAELTHQLQSVRDETETIKSRAAALVETLFGRPTCEPERATPRLTLPSQVVKSERPNVLPEHAPREAHQASRIPSLQL